MNGITLLPHLRELAPSCVCNVDEIEENDVGEDVGPPSRKRRRPNPQDDAEVPVHSLQVFNSFFSVNLRMAKGGTFYKQFRLCALVA